MTDREWIQLLGMTVRKNLPDGMSEAYRVAAVFTSPAVQLENIETGEIISFTVDSPNGQNWSITKN